MDGEIFKMLQECNSSLSSALKSMPIICRNVACGILSDFRLLILMRQFSLYAVVVVVVFFFSKEFRIQPKCMLIL